MLPDHRSPRGRGVEKHKVVALLRDRQSEQEALEQVELEQFLRTAAFLARLSLESPEDFP